MLRPVEENKAFPRFFAALCVCVICLGITARIFLYVRNDSFWLDETYVAYQTTQETFGEIFSGVSVLEGQPVSPLLFSSLEKISSLIFGNHELALRLVPLLFGILSLFIFYKLSKLFFKKKEMAYLALALFAVSPPLIRYSAELKMYASDVFSAVLILYLFERCRLKGWTPGRILGLGLLCGALMWLSYPVVFFLPGIFLVWLFDLKNRREGRKIKALIFIASVWVISGVWLCLLFFQRLGADGELVEMWRTLGAFPSADAGVFSTGSWLAERISSMFAFFFSSFTAWICTALFFAGTVSAWRKDRERAVVFLMPAVCVLFAAFLGKYPFHERMILFLAPVVILLCAQGIVFVIKILPSRLHESVLIFLAFLLLAGPLRQGVGCAFFEKGKTENRMIFQYLKKTFQPGDLVIMNNEAQFPFVYYVSALDFDINGFPATARKGGTSIKDASVFRVLPEDNIDREAGSALLSEQFFKMDGQGRFFPKLRSRQTFDIGRGVPFCFTDKPRVWLIFSHLPDEKKDFYLDAFSAHGRRLDQFRVNGASLYLYNFSRGE